MPLTVVSRCTRTKETAHLIAEKVVPNAGLLDVSRTAEFEAESISQSDQRALDCECKQTRLLTVDVSKCRSKLAVATRLMRAHSSSSSSSSISQFMATEQPLK